MGRKTATFSDKLAKMKKQKNEGPGEGTPVLYIKSERSEKTGAYRFTENIVKMTPENEKDLIK